jgi:hypothetical protein
MEEEAAEVILIVDAIVLEIVLIVDGTHVIEATVTEEMTMTIEIEEIVPETVEEVIVVIEEVMIDEMEEEVDLENVEMIDAKRSLVIRLHSSCYFTSEEVC